MALRFKKITDFSPGIFTCISLTSLILSSAFITPKESHAQVGLSPLKIEVQANRGQAQHVIDITNNGNEVFRARVYAEAFTYEKDTGFKILKSSPTDLRPYLQFSPRELVVPPRSKRRVRLVARLAPSLPDGEYRAIVFTEPLKENAVKGSQNSTTRIITRVGTVFLVRKGNINPRLSIDKAQWDNRSNKLQLLVKNDGQASAFTSVDWSIKKEGKAIKNGELKAHAIMPENARNLTLISEEKNQFNLAPGDYKLSGKLVWGKNGKNQQSFNVGFTVPAQK